MDKVKACEPPSPWCCFPVDHGSRHDGASSTQTVVESVTARAFPCAAAVAALVSERALLRVLLICSPLLSLEMATWFSTVIPGRPGLGLGQTAAPGTLERRCRGGRPPGRSRHRSAPGRLPVRRSSFWRSGQPPTMRAESGMYVVPAGWRRSGWGSRPLPAPVLAVTRKLVRQKVWPLFGRTAARDGQRRARSRSNSRPFAGQGPG